MIILQTIACAPRPGHERLRVRAGHDAIIEPTAVQMITDVSGNPYLYNSHDVFVSSGFKMESNGITLSPILVLDQFLC